MEKRLVGLGFLGIVLGSAVSAFAGSGGPGRATIERLVRGDGSTSVAFEENLGQTDSAVRFLARAPEGKLFLTDSGAIWRTDESRGSSTRRDPAVLRLTFAGARSLPPSGENRLVRTSNYFIGNDPERWRAGVPNFGKVRYRNAYPGIDIVYYGAGDRLEFDLVVSPGSDPEKIRLRLDGAESVTRGLDGDLRVALGGREFRLRRPVIYQEGPGGERRSISGEYAVLDAAAGAPAFVAFRLGRYDATRPLVVDPVLEYATYLGGSEDDFGSAIAVDAAGNAYVTGFTTSLAFPGTTGSGLQPGFGGDSDVFVTKINAAGTGIVYSTYLGGSGGDDWGGIAVDSAGNAYVVGATSSSDFPTLHPIQALNRGTANAFVSKIDPSGTSLVYSTLLGGDGYAFADTVALDASGSVFVVGDTTSSNFPVTAGAVQTTPGGGYDVFVTHINAAGTAWTYSTLLGRSGDDHGFGIAVDPAGNAYVTGRTSSPNFPGTSSSAIQPAYAGAGDEGEDAFVAKLNPAGTGLLYSTYLGGAGFDSGNAIAIDSSGNAYVTGKTNSSNFPGTSSASVQHAPGGQFDAFVTKINEAGTAIRFSTYLGGNGDENPGGIAVDAARNVYVAGSTHSGNFPVVQPIQEAYGGGNDVFVTEINGAGTVVLFSTYLGGSGDDDAYALAIDGSGGVYLTGQTLSSNFPGASASAIQPHYAGGEDAFALKLSIAAPCDGGNEGRPCSVRVPPVSLPAEVSRR